MLAHKAIELYNTQKYSLVSISNPHSFRFICHQTLHMKKVSKFLLFLFLSISVISFYGCDENGDTDCQLFDDCDGGGGGGGGGSCYVDVYFDNYDFEDYTVESSISGNEYYVPSYGSYEISLSSNSCATYYIYDYSNSTYMGSASVCPCSYSNGTTVTVTIDYF